MVSFRTALNVLFYSLLERIGCLRPTLIQRFHGLKRPERPLRASCDVDWILELIIALITFYYWDDSFCTGEVLHKIRGLVDGEKANQRREVLKSDYENRLDLIAPKVSSLLIELEKKEKEVDEARGTERFESVRYFYEDWMRNEGILVNVWRDLSVLITQADPEVPEVFDRMFFSTEIPDTGASSLKGVISKSNSYALRSGESQIWRFNRTRKMIVNSICCEDALRLVVEYELLLFKLSSAGTLHWIFQTTKAVIRSYNDRTMDPSKWQKTIVTKKEIPNDDYDVGEGPRKWGWEEKENLPDGPSDPGLEMRKVTLYVIVH